MNKALTYLSYLGLIGLAVAQDDARDTLEYSQEFDAIARATEDQGRLLTGYGMRGSIEFWKKYNNDDIYVQVDLMIDSSQIENKQLF